MTAEQTAVRDAIVAMFLETGEDGRVSHSKDYRGFEVGAHKVFVYGPTRAFLRGMIKGGAL